LRRCATLAAEIAIDVPVVLALVVDDRGAAVARDLGFAFDAIAPGLDATIDAIDRQRPAAVIVDDYAVTTEIFAALHATSPKLLVLDDLADRNLAVDAVLNAAPSASTLAYAAPLQLLGPRYALLRREFRDLPMRDTGDVRRVLVTFGGSDPEGRSQTIGRALAAAMPGATVELVLGPLVEAEFPDDAGIVVHRSPRNMVELMMRADLAVAAGGQTTYELAACGVPTLAVCIADNQRVNLEALSHVPTLQIVNDENVVAKAIALSNDRAARSRLSSAGQQLFDGRGAERAWQALHERWFGAQS
jgi:spore coat polysaccharide biosynthesis predicted glycosyltransferase SpsG